MIGGNAATKTRPYYYAGFDRSRHRFALLFLAGERAFAQTGQPSASRVQLRLWRDWRIEGGPFYDLELVASSAWEEEQRQRAARPVVTPDHTMTPRPVVVELVMRH